MKALAARTGVHVITFMTRSHVNDDAMPGWYATPGSVNFFTEALHLNPWDVMRQFEQWGCAKASSKSYHLQLL